MTIRQSIIPRFLALPLVLALGLSGALAAAPATRAATGTPQEFVSFTAGNGAQSNYHFYPSGRESAGLLVHLDGDGQYGHNNPKSTYALGGTNGIVAKAHAQGFDVLSAKTPAQDNTWWTACSTNTRYMNDLLSHIRSANGSGETWFSGFSGGSEFLTGCYLPTQANTVGANGAVVFGGGGRPWVKVTPFTADTLASMSMHWVTGLDDTAANARDGYDALGKAQASEEYYAAAGFRTSGTWPEGVDHYNIGGRFGTYLGQVLEANQVQQPEPTTTQEPEPTTTQEPEPVAHEWVADVQPGRYHANITVDVPADADRRTIVWVYGPRGTYWYEYLFRRGTGTVQIGDRGDWLSPRTSYRYEVVNGGAVQASGTFTTAGR